jgi:hypothetical protein
VQLKQNSNLPEVNVLNLHFLEVWLSQLGQNSDLPEVNVLNSQFPEVSDFINLILF